MARILVTGGLGFIGANLVPLLAKSGYDVAVLDNLVNNAVPSIEGIRTLVADVSSAPEVLRALEEWRPDVVVHLAASGSVVQSVSNPIPNFESNCVGTLNALNASRLTGVSRFVFASTGGALMGDAVPPVSEQSLPRPKSPYGASKLCGEAYCHAFAGSYGVHSIILRFANVYGPISNRKKGAVTAFIQAVMHGEPIRIFGDGSSTRDFLYVEDVCRGIASAIDVDCEPGSVFHLASGVETSILELAREVAEIAGVERHPLEFAPERAGEVERNFADAERARSALGFESRTALRAGLKLTWEWFEGSARNDA